MDSEQLSLNIQLEENSPQQTTVECLGMTASSQRLQIGTANPRGRNLAGSDAAKI